MAYTLRYADKDAKTSKIIISYDGKDYQSALPYYTNEKVEHHTAKHTTLVPYGDEVRLLKFETMHYISFKAIKLAFSLSWANPGKQSKLRLKYDGTIYYSTIDYDNTTDDELSKIRRDYRLLQYINNGRSAVLTSETQNMILFSTSFTLSWVDAGLKLVYEDVEYISKHHTPHNTGDIFDTHFRYRPVQCGDNIKLICPPLFDITFEPVVPEYKIRQENEKLILSYEGRDYVNSSCGDKSIILGVCDLRREDKDTLILTNKIGYFATFKADIPPQFTLNWENPSEPSSRLLLKLMGGKEYISNFKHSVVMPFRDNLTYIRERYNVLKITGDSVHLARSDGSYIPFELKPKFDISKVMSLINKFRHNDAISVKLFNELLMKMGSSMQVILEHFASNYDIDNFKKIIEFVVDVELLVKYDLTRYGSIIFDYLISKDNINEDVLAKVYALLNDELKKVARKNATTRLMNNIHYKRYTDESIYRNTTVLIQYCDLSPDAK